MTKFQDFLKDQLQDSEFRSEYEALEPEFAIIQTLIDARKRSGMTQKQLSEKTGIAQADISKLEHGNANPSIRTLRRLADGLGLELRLEFIVPKKPRRKAIRSQHAVPADVESIETTHDARLKS